MPANASTWTPDHDTAIRDGRGVTHTANGPVIGYPGENDDGWVDDLAVPAELDFVPIASTSAPRAHDLSSLETAMAAVRAQKAFYFSHPDWHGITRQYQTAIESLRDLKAKTGHTIAQIAHDTARTTFLAASIIARHAARLYASLTGIRQNRIPGAQQAQEAMRNLTRAAENLAARAAGLYNHWQPQTLQQLLDHIRHADTELKEPQTATPPDPAAKPPATSTLADPHAATLDAALRIGAQTDPGLGEAAELFDAITNLTIPQRAHRLSLDIRLHGTVKTLTLRAYETISNRARHAMQRNDTPDSPARRAIAETIHHITEEHLERLRGTLEPGAQRPPGHYQTHQPNRHMQTLFNEQRAIALELRAQHLTPTERTDLQIRRLLGQRAMATATNTDTTWLTEPRIPPNQWVAGANTKTPLQTRQDLINELNRRAQANPNHVNTPFFTALADRYAREIAGPRDLSAEALAAHITASQIRTVANHLVDTQTPASPLALSSNTQLNLTYPQAERILAVLHTLKVVGPLDRPQTRHTLTRSSGELGVQLTLLEDRLPILLALQHDAAALAHNNPTPHPAPHTPVTPSPAPEPTTQSQHRAEPPAPPAHEEPTSQPAATASKAKNNESAPTGPDSLEGLEARLERLEEQLRRGRTERQRYQPPADAGTPANSRTRGRATTDRQQEAPQIQPTSTAVTAL